MHEDIENGTFTIQENGELITIDMSSGEVVSSSKTPICKKHQFPYSVELGQAICTMIREGLTMSQVSLLDGMPALSTIFGWKTRYPDFRYNMKQARKDSGQIYHDRIVQTLEDNDGIEAMSGAELAKARFKVDTLKWLAEKNNPDDFGNKTKISGDSENPLGIAIIDTGIRRKAPEPVEVVNEAESWVEDEDEEDGQEE